MLKEASVVSFDETRLAETRARLIMHIGSESVNKNKGWFALPLFSGRAVAWAVFAAVLLISTGAAAVFYWRTYVAPSSNENFAEGKGGTDGSKPAAGKKRHGVSAYKASEPAAPEPDKTLVIDAGLPSEGNRQLRPPPGPPPLSEQVKLFNKAKVAAASKEFDAALQYLDRLRTRWPKGPLTLEAKELTAQILAESHRYSEASQAVSALIRAKIPTRKKAQLYRFLGDLQVKQHRCNGAVESYRTALGLGLSDAESAAAKAGIKTCIP